VRLSTRTVRRHSSSTPRQPDDLPSRIVFAVGFSFVIGPTKFVNSVGPMLCTWLLRNRTSAEAKATNRGPLNGSVRVRTPPTPHRTETNKSEADQAEGRGFGHGSSAIV
jgi:hypothetical protein